MRRTAALIVGGGPAGSAAAITLARGGAAPLLIERHAEPHDVVCGGFLGWDALAALSKLGLDPAALGARPIHRLRLIAGKRRIETSLPHAAAGLSRRTLDEALLARAAQEGVGIERGLAAKRAEGLTVALGDGASLTAEALFLATGKYELRGLARPRAAAGQDPAVGLRTRLSATSTLAGALHDVIELHLFAHGYAGLLLQEDGSANLCLSVAASRLAKPGGNAEALIAALSDEAPLLADRLGSATAIGPWSAVAGVPYGWRARTAPPGLFRLGDQAAVIASLAGDGVAIALNSGRAAAEAWVRHGPNGSAAFQSRFARRAARPLGIAGLLRAAGENRRIAPPLLGLIGHVPGIAALLARATRIGS